MIRRDVMAAFAAAVVGMSLGAPGPARSGSLYQYTDDKGNIHYVQDKNQIPTKYQERTERRAIIHETPEDLDAAPAEAGEAGAEGAPAGKSDEIGPVPGVDLTGLPKEIDPATVVGRDPKTGQFILDPGRPERLKKEKKDATELLKKQKLGQADKEGQDEAFWRKKIADCRAELRKTEERYNQANQTYNLSPNKFGDPAAAGKVQTLKTQVDAKRVECDSIPSQARSAGAPAGWVR